MQMNPVPVTGIGESSAGHTTGHMHAVPHDHESLGISFYMPHHSVLTESSISTKLVCGI